MRGMRARRVPAEPDRTRHSRGGIACHRRSSPEARRMSARRLQSRAPAPSFSAGAWLAPLAGHWVEAAAAYLSKHAAVARVTVVALRGSAPREPGASMLVDLDAT